jgi:pyruvate dehydrogenase E1 component beta subunit
MPTILMPALSPTMEEGKLAKWLKAVGDHVKSGDVLAEIETDKATMEIEAIDEGVLSAILVAEGTEGVKVNAPIAVIGEASLTATPSSGASAPPSPSRGEGKKEATSNVPSPLEGEGARRADEGGAKLSDPEIPAGTEMITMTVREALRSAMSEEMRLDKDVFLMGEEVGQYQGAYKISQGMLDEFGPERVLDTPITEHGFTGIATGAAFAGLKPIVEFMTFNFAMQAIDHIINSAAKTLYMSGGQMGCSIVFRGANGAAARVGAQHSQDYTAWYAQIPGLKVIAPYSAADAKGLMKAAIRDPNPIIFLENEILYGKSFEVPNVEDWVVPIGKARIARVGSHVTIVSFSIGMTYALAAAEKLAAEGIDCEVIDLRTIRPLDLETVLTSVKKTNRCVCVEEGYPRFSVTSELAAEIMTHAFDYLDAPVARVAGKDVPMPYAANLEKLALPTVDDVVAAVKGVLYV